MTRTIRYTAIVLLCAVVLVPVASLKAESATSTDTVAALTAQISALLQQINNLQTQISSLHGQKKQAATELRTITRESTTPRQAVPSQSLGGV